MRSLRRPASVLLLAAPLLAGPVPGVHAQEPKAVAVLRFDNNTEDDRYDNLGRGLAAMMISDLSVVDGIRLVERERLEDLTRELDLQHSGRVDPATAGELGLIVGAEYVVTGAFITVEPEMRLDSRVVRVETSEIVRTADVRGESETLFDLQERLAASLIEGFGIVLDEEQRARLAARQESNRIDDVETLVRFSSALCLLDAGYFVEALDEMNEVRERAPASALVGATFDLLEERAKEEAKDRLVDEANSRIGRFLGRDAPRERRERPRDC